MNRFTFNSRTTGGAVLPEATEKEIKDEPMLFKCNGEYAMELGGRLTHLFLSALPEDWKNTPILIDSRSHMLMPGWFPCIPGWHHDDVPRERADGQPDYIDPSYYAEHVMALWGDASLTEFAIGEETFDDVPMGGVYYREWHSEVELMIQRKQLIRTIANQRQLIFFNWQTWHQGTPATKSGWRFFIRATRYSKAKPSNEIRHQAQVYLPAPMAGW